MNNVQPQTLCIENGVNSLVSESTSQDRFMVHRFVLILLVFASCRAATQPDNSGASQPDTTVGGVSNPMPIHDSQPTQRWIAYKKGSTIDRQDTLPYTGCYIAITDSVCTYYRHDTVAEKYTLVPLKGYGYKVYGFKEVAGDRLICLDTLQTKWVLKRNNTDGDQEYFLLEQ